MSDGFAINNNYLLPEDTQKGPMFGLVGIPPRPGIAYKYPHE
jgi:hypothetical protein